MRLKFVKTFIKLIKITNCVCGNICNGCDVAVVFAECLHADMLPFSLCNKEIPAIRHMNRPLFPRTLSIPSYDIGKQVGLRTYQHLHVNSVLCSAVFVLCTVFFSITTFIGWKAKVNLHSLYINYSIEVYKYNGTYFQFPRRNSFSER